MDSHRLSIFASAFLGAISASLVSLLFMPGAADPRVGVSRAATASAPVLPVGPARGYHARPDAGVQPDAGVDDGPLDDCDLGDFCDGFDGNDPIEV